MEPTPRPSWADPQPRLRRRPALLRAISAHRRLLAVVCAVAAAAATLQLVVPNPPHTVRVVAARAALSGGHTITRDDLTTVELPPDVAPDRAVTDASVLIGRVLVASVTTRQVITESAVVSPRMSSGAGTAMIVPVRLGDPEVIALLAVGDLIDIVASDGQTSASNVVAAGARVAVIPQSAKEGPLGTGGSGGGLILVEVEPPEATALSTAAGSARLTVVWRSTG